MLETIAKVINKQLFGNGYCRLRIEIPAKLTIGPGQFAMLKPQGLIEPLLRRAMAFYQVDSLYNCTQADFIFHILGPGTQALAHVRPNDGIEFLGPLGQSFLPQPAYEIGGAIIVGGGVGTPALLMLAQQLQAQQLPLQIFLGARSSGDLIGVADFEALSCPLTIATDDGSVGERGFVTQPLERFLQQPGHSHYVVYTCGPDPMMHRTTEIATRYGLKTYASLEARMACGFGVCVGCVVEVVKPDATTSYQRVCVEGPVFTGSEVVW